jgi:hypothetical protein
MRFPQFSFGKRRGSVWMRFAIYMRKNHESDALQRFGLFRFHQLRLDKHHCLDQKLARKLVRMCRVEINLRGRSLRERSRRAHGLTLPPTLKLASRKHPNSGHF